MKIRLARKIFVQNTYSIYYENPATCSIADTMSQTDRHGLHTGPSFLKEIPHKFGRYVPLNVAVQIPVLNSLQLCM
jgi:hypothetical protein